MLLTFLSFILKNVGSLLLEIVQRGGSVFNLLYSLLFSWYDANYSLYMVFDIPRIILLFIFEAYNNILNYNLEVFKFFIVRVFRIVHYVPYEIEILLKILITIFLIVHIYKVKIEAYIRRNIRHRSYRF